MKAIVTVFACSILLAALVAGPAAAQLHSVLVAAPTLPEEALTWCGPAVGEMIIEGFPSGACAVIQADVWASIDANRVEAVWDTDPVGMEKALEQVCPGSSWSVFARNDAAELMFSVAFWMTNNSFPAAVVLDTAAHNAVAAHQEHWVMVKGVVTDADPTTTSTATLQFVWVTDPSPAIFGDPAVERFISAGTWFGELSAVSKPASTYNGKFVAVIEPPEKRGRLLGRIDEVLTGRLLDARRIVEIAQRWLEEVEILREVKSFRRFYDAKPMKPIPIDPEKRGYYLVPFTTDGERAFGAVLVNAYKGNVQEAGVIAPVRYLDREEALHRAAKHWRVRSIDELKASLHYAPAAGSTSRYDPVWRVTDGRRSLVIRQDGSVREWPKRGRELEPDQPG